MIPYAPYPELFTLNLFGLSITLYTYGLFVGLGLLIGLLVAQKLASEKGISHKIILDIALFGFLGGLIGARIHYLILFGGNPFAIWEGGLIFQGGLIGALLTVYVYTRYKSIKFLRVLDVCAPALALGHGIGRLGCFFRGCCYGIAMKTVMPWAIDYLGALRHPAQLYSSFANFSLFGMLMWLRKKSKIDGFVTACYLTGYSILRFIIEFFRTEPQYLAFLSGAQIIALVTLSMGLGMFYLIIKKRVTF